MSTGVRCACSWPPERRSHCWPGPVALALAATSGGGSPFGDQQVGGTYANGILLPTQQWIKPIGTRVLTDKDGRLLSSSISPNGQYLAALTWNDFTGCLTIINVQTGQIIQQIGTGVGSDKILGDGTVAADGPLWSADGKTLWFPQTSDLVHFAVAADGTVSSPVVIPLSTTIVNLTTGNTTVPDLPSGMALSQDGSKLYVALNGVNKLGVIDTATNQLIQVIPVGNAPRQVVLVGNDAFVSNEGGRPAKPGEYTNNSAGTEHRGQQGHRGRHHRHSVRGQPGHGSPGQVRSRSAWSRPPSTWPPTAR